MSEHFDPYHSWLGIPVSEQPPDYYRLLGISRFEEDRDVISNAYAQRVRYVRTYELGEHASLSQQLLNELANARSCLLDPIRKAAYDQQRRSETAQDDPPPVPVQSATHRERTRCVEVVGVLAGLIVGAIVSGFAVGLMLSGEQRQIVKNSQSSNLKAGKLNSDSSELQVGRKLSESPDYRQTAAQASGGRTAATDEPSTADTPRNSVELRNASATPTVEELPKSEESESAGGPFFFSINIRSDDNDELVQVNATTGQVTTIGSLESNLELDFPSLAFANGRLFLVNPTTAANPTDLVELNPSTGEVLFSSRITLAGNTIPLVEGFDSTGGELVISYGMKGSEGIGTRSNRIGTLSRNGTISGSITLSASEDLDGIAIDRNGQFFGVDAKPRKGGSDILSVDLTPPSTVLLSTIGSTGTNIVDLAFTDASLLFGLDIGGGARRIHQIDPATGESLSNVTISSSWKLRGLACCQLDAHSTR